MAETCGHARERRVWIAGLIALALLPGCAGGAVRGEAFSPAQPLAAAGDEQFAAAAGILDGFELPSPGEAESDKPSWRFGDRVLLGLRIVRGGRSTVRYLDVELLARTSDPSHVAITLTSKDGASRRYDSVAFATRIRLYDEACRVLAEVEGSFPMIMLEIGMYDAVRIDVEARAAGEDLETKQYTDEEYRDAGLGWFSLAAFSGSMGENRVFADLMAEVVRRPAWWRLLLKPTVSLNYVEPLASVAPAWRPAPGASHPSYLVPLELRISEEPVLLGELTVVRPEGPLGLCGGLIHAIARRAGDPDTHAEIRLLACRRGPALPSRSPEPQPARVEPAPGR